MSMTQDSVLFKSVLSRLDKLRGPDNKGNYISICPLHNDHNQSLSLHPEKGINCFSPGCEAHGGISLKDIAQKLGVSIEKSPKNDAIEATYDYVDEEGTLLFQVVRMFPKKFRQRRPGKEGEWIWNLNGTRRVLFNLPAIINAPKDDWIFICEGEKDALRLIESGLIATTNPGGAGKWKSEYNDVFQDRKVVILEDNDPAGAEHVQKVTIELSPVTSDLRAFKLPNLPLKGDVSDWLNTGNSIDELHQLATTATAGITQLAEGKTGHGKIHHEYVIDDGELCLIKTSSKHGTNLFPLASFVPTIVDELIRDDGAIEEREYVVAGTLGSGKILPHINVKESEFSSMNWARRLWGAQANIYPGSTTKDHVRSYLQQSRNGHEPKRIYTHTGWREQAGKRVYLTASGGLGCQEFDVDLAGRFSQYSLPTDLDTVDPIEAMRASISFMDFGQPEVMIPLWAMMYLAPLTELFNPAFILWLHGPSGAFKSTISALAICHFGAFTHLSLPGNWESTSTTIENDMFACKDVPFVIDDWKPGATVEEQKELEKKAAKVIRAQGNRSARGRSNPDSSRREDKPPRGVVITSGEQLPAGASDRARLLILDMVPGRIDIDHIDIAQGDSPLYSYAMANYIKHLGDHWDELQQSLPERWKEYRKKANIEGIHLRLPAVVACLYTSMEIALSFAHRINAITKEEMETRLKDAWQIFVDLATRQGGRVNEERPGNRFLEAFKTLLNQDRLVLINRAYVRHSDIIDCTNDKPCSLRPYETFVGWEDEEYYYLIPEAINKVIREFYNKSGSAFSYSKQAIWADLFQLGATDPQTKDKTHEYQKNIKVGLSVKIQNKWVINLKKSSCKTEDGDGF